MFRVSRRSFFETHPHFQCPAFTSTHKSLSDIHFTPPVFSVSYQFDYPSPRHMSHFKYRVLYMNHKILDRDTLHTSSVQCFTSIRLSASEKHYTLLMSSISHRFKIHISDTLHTSSAQVSHQSDSPFPKHIPYFQYPVSYIDANPLS